MKPQSNWGVLARSLLSTLLLLAAFPPLNLFPLAWIAPLGWLLLCNRETPVGRKGYWAIWLCGCFYWLVTLHSVRLAFWALYAGWIALSLYLAIYLPLFVGATRLLVHRWNVPLALAAPIAWTGFELIRSYLFTGYAANTLAHTQAFQPRAIQIVDQLGVGGLSFLMMVFAACVFQAIARGVDGKRIAALIPASLAVLVLGSVLGYGTWRLKESDRLAAENSPLFRCLLLQENTPSIFEVNPNVEAHVNRSHLAWTQYANLCRQAIQNSGPVDLVVWPESTFTSTTPYYEWNVESDELHSEIQSLLEQYHLTRDELRDVVSRVQHDFSLKSRVAVRAAEGLDPLSDHPESNEAHSQSPLYDSQSAARNASPSLLVGCERTRYSDDGIQRTNSAIWIGPDGQVQDHYAKMHLVMFGEFIPLEPVLGWLSDLFGFASVQKGDQPKSFEIAGVYVSPNICFESMVPRLIRWQVKELAAQNQSPDVLINLTNDSWFQGSSMLDHHLASSILCSVENRRPMLVAANTGVSAEIDGSGRLLQRADRLTAQAIVAEPRRDSRWGLVQAVGYPLSWLCAAVSVLVLAAGRQRRPQ